MGVGTKERPSSARRGRGKVIARRARSRRLLAGGSVLAALAIVGAIALSGEETRRASGVTIDAPARSDTIPVGEVAPDFTAPFVGGGTGTLSRELGGSPGVIVFWAPWCPHCHDQMPVVDRVARGYPGVVVTSVAIWIGERPGPTPEKVLADTGVSYGAYRDDAAGSLSGAYGITATPGLYFLDTQRRVVIAEQTVMDEAQLRAAFDAIAQ